LPLDKSEISIFSDIKLLHALNRCEPDPIFANPDPTLPSTELKTIALLSELCEKELVATIGWAKQIPGCNCLFLMVFVLPKFSFG